MVLTQLLLFGILLASPSLWFRWWHFNRFTSYAWGSLVLMACFGIVFLNFGEVDWLRIIGLFVFVLVLTIAKHLHARKRAVERADPEH